MLLITAFEPSFSTGGQMFTYHLIESLKDKYIIDLIYFTNEKKYLKIKYDVRQSTGVHVSKINKLVNWALCPYFHPIFSGRFSWRRLFMIKAMNRKEKYDILFFDFSQTHLYSHYFKKSNTLVTCHDVLYQKFKRENLLKRFQLRYIYSSEKELLKNNKIFTFSKKDTKIISKVYSLKSEYTSPFINSKISEATVLEAIQKENYFLFFGSWRRPENLDGLLWFLKEVNPYIQNIKILIIGTGLEKSMISNSKNIKYMGFVDNPYSVIMSCKALLAPVFYGAGIKVKVFEALACGIPVVGTDIAFEGFGSDLKKFLYLSNSREEFIKNIKTIYEYSNEFRDEILKTFYAHYNVPKIVKYLYQD